MASSSSVIRRVTISIVAVGLVEYPQRQYLACRDSRSVAAGHGEQCRTDVVRGAHLTTRRLFGVPVVTTNAQAAGVGHVIASGAVALDTDDRGVDLQYSENATADSFGKNLVFARCESLVCDVGVLPVGCGVAGPEPARTKTLRSSEA